MDASRRQLANALRALAMDAVQAANSGHPGMPMGMADVATVLFRDFLKFSAAHPNWCDRDRFILSAGHGSMLLYALLHCCGYEGYPMSELRRFRQLHAVTPGHPEYDGGGGIETTTGPLGQGLANGVGMALAERLLAARYGEALCDHRTWVVAGDGCLMEGISHEAMSLAGHLRLAKLTVLFDDNQISIDGDTDLAVRDDTLARVAAYGWRTVCCDGHDEEAIAAALRSACESDKPTLVACRTTIGFGAPTKQGTAAVHGAPLGEDEVAAAREQLNWDSPPFVLPDAVASAWRAIGARGAADEAAWEERRGAHPQGDDFVRRMKGELPADWETAWRLWRDSLSANEGTAMATRQASGKTLEAMLPALPELLGGSADLTGSNNTYAGQAVVRPFTAEDGGGGSRDSGGTSYVHYGVREHAMAAAMNGIALHGGFIPYGGTFLVFSDYCRPAIRLSALMGVRVIYVLTHDSIGLGEDGPTHQPIEHLTALRVIPNLQVWRPCDAAETAECWRLALLTADAPSVLALSRQGLPPLSGAVAHQCEHGGYVLSGGEGARALTLAASGSEVSLAVSLAARLAEEGVAAAVVSVPCMERFRLQPAAWRRRVLPPEIPLLTIEASHPMAWRSLAHENGVERSDCVGIERFGVSAPAADAYEHLGITAELCLSRARALLTS